jgi:hypothetical protein
VCYPKFSPLLGHQYLLLGNMHLVLENIDTSLVYLQKAMKIFKVTYDEENPIRFELGEKLKLIEGEI